MKNILGIAAIALAIILGANYCTHQKTQGKLEATKLELKQTQSALDRCQQEHELTLGEVNELDRTNHQLQEQVTTLKTAKGRTSKVTTRVRTSTKIDTSATTIKRLQDSISSLKRITEAQQDSIIYFAQTYPDSVNLLKGYINTLICNPTFYSEHQDQWALIESISNRDSTVYNIQLFDELIITHDRKKRFLRPDIYTVKVQSSSPYTTLRGISSYEVSSTPKRLGIGFNLSAAYSTTSNSIQPQVGVGLNYNLFNIR